MPVCRAHTCRQNRFTEHQSSAEQFYLCKTHYNSVSWILPPLNRWKELRLRQIKKHTYGQSQYLSSNWKHSMTPRCPGPPTDCLAGMGPEIFVFEKLPWWFLITCHSSEPLLRIKPSRYPCHQSGLWAAFSTLDKTFKTYLNSNFEKLCSIWIFLLISKWWQTDT